MHGLVVIEGMTLSGHPWIINEILFKERNTITLKKHFFYFRSSPEEDKSCSSSPKGADEAAEADLSRSFPKVFPSCRH